MSTRRTVLKDLRESSERYDQMIQILDDIETLKAVPDKLEQQISQKFFLSAYSTLSDALKISEKENLQNIATLQPIKAYLATQESLLFNILIKELNNHLYLKSPYCDSRWHTYKHGSGETGDFEQMLEDKIKFDLSEKSSSFSETSLLDGFLTTSKNEFVELQNENAEENSFYYIRLVIETLGKLGRLPNAFDILALDLPIELHKIVDKTIAEVIQRSPKSMTALTTSKKSPYAIFEVGLEAGDNSLAALKDLTWTLYSKFIAVLQAHRVIYEVSQMIYDAGKQDQGALPPYDFSAAYAAVETEISGLLDSYVTDKSMVLPLPLSEQSISFQLNKGSDILYRRPRDKRKLLFKFSNIDLNHDELKEQHEQLKKALEKSVPGLVSAANSDLADDEFNPYLPLESTSTHQLIVPPIVVNIRVMIEPTVQFFQKVMTIFPTKAPKPSDDFVEKFLITTCVPQLEQALGNVFEATLCGPDGTVADVFEYSTKWNKVSKLPILKAMIAFMELIQRTCSLLSTSNIYRQYYAGLVLQLIQRFVNLVKNHYESKVVYQEASDDRSGYSSTGPSKPTTKRKLAAVWVANPHTRQLLSSTSPYEYDDNYSDSNEPPYKQEFEFYHSKRSAQKTKNPTPITESDLLSFSMYQSIAALVTSLRWLSVKLRKLRRVGETDKAGDDVNLFNNLSTKLRKRWVLLDEFKSSNADNTTDAIILDDVGLTLAGESISIFDKEVDAIDQLADTCVLTLKADLRCRTIYYIDKTMKEGQYYLDADTEERDVYIAKLDAAIINCDAITTESLVADDKSVVVAGLAKFIDELLITAADGLQYLNEYGLKKMGNNICVFQQILKSISESPQSVDFSRSLAFYNLTKNSSLALLELAKARETGGFSHDELKTVLRLIRYRTVRKYELSGRRDLMQTEKNALHDDLMKLHDFYWGSEKVEM